MSVTLDETRLHSNRILDEVERSIIGKRGALETVLGAILAGGHVLLEDFPGLAKTLMARSFAQAIGIDFSRVQFTPDLLPGDVTGSLVYRQHEGTFEFRRGPIFTNLLLADEINRATPKTQAALLEAMQEGQVTIEETTHQLDTPFIVIATQNPIEYEGTYPLPEAQLDRFILRTSLGYPERSEEWEILRRRVERGEDEVALETVVDGALLVSMQRSIEDVHVSESIGYYIVDLVTATRRHVYAQVGASPRGALAVLKLARVRAVMDGRDYVTPEDVKAVAGPALGHRISLKPEFWVRRITGDQVVAEVLDEVPTPPVRESQLRP
jgi:MoxR-like ATPase